MGLTRKYALLMELPEGKLPGFYAQIIKALAANSPLFDRDKEMLIFSAPEERNAAHTIMEQYKIPYEEAELLLLPDPLETQPLFSDYGWITRSEHAYVYVGSGYIFKLLIDYPNAEPDQAVQQIAEHLWASFQYGEDPENYYLTDMDSKELMERIAKAYHCGIQSINY